MVKVAETESVDETMDLEEELVAANATTNSSIEALEKQIFELDTNTYVLEEDSDEE